MIWTSAVTWCFLYVAEELPDHYETIADLFRRKGAYARYKDFLDHRALLEKWYGYESRMTEAALRAWCKENDIEVT